MCLRRIAIDYNITLEKSSPSIIWIIISRFKFILRIAQLLQSTSLFPSFHHFSQNDGDITHISLFQSPFLESLELSNISGFKNTIVGPFLASFPSHMVRKIALDNGQISSPISRAFRCSFYERFYSSGSPWDFTVPGRFDFEGFRSCISSRARRLEFKSPECQWGSQVF